MTHHDSRRDAAALPVVDALGYAVAFIKAQQPRECDVAAGSCDEGSSLGRVHAAEFKRSVYRMSNGAFNRVLNNPFTIRGMAEAKRSRSLLVVERLQRVHGLNRSELARRLNVTAGAVTNWFRRGTVPVESHMKIIEAFGVSADDLIDRPGAPPSTAIPVLPHRSAEAAQFAAEWDKIRDPLIRAQIRAMVEAAAKVQMDEDRKHKLAPTPRPSGPRNS